MPAAPKPVIRRDPDYYVWVRGRPCLVCGLPGQPAHVSTRRNGGDRENIVPLCSCHHREQHTVGIKSFQEKYSLDLRARAIALDQDYSQQ